VNSSNVQIAGKLYKAERDVHPDEPMPHLCSVCCLPFVPTCWSI